VSVPRWFRNALRNALHIATDAAAVFLAFYIAYTARFSWGTFLQIVPISGEDPGWSHWRLFLQPIVPLWILIFASSCRLYSRSYSSPFDRLLRIIQGAFFGTVVTLVAAFLYSRLGYSRLTILMAGPIAVATMSASHAFVLWIDGLLAALEATRPLLLIGGGNVSELIRDHVQHKQPRRQILETSDLPEIDDLVARARDSRVGEIVLVRSDLDRKALLEIAEACESENIQFRMIPDLLELRLGEIQMDESLGLPAYRLQHTQLTRANFAAKRAFDVLFSGAVLVFLGPLMLLIAVLIRLGSKGPALFKQERMGFRGERFEAFKFRTMVADAEKRIAEIKTAANDQKGGFFKAKSDPRVTRIGFWLRRFSLDELPQFINVLFGTMSVVGPRPLAFSTGEMDELIKNFGSTAKKRVNTMPGITGLWQVSGRSDISAEERFKLDMFYIEHWSLGLDLEIILKTVPAMISGKGAY
jgi:exopolysaccharide biosynthesis polyprenyl glycosylphosphotransferase